MQTPIEPLMLAKLFRVNQDEVAFHLRVSTDYMRRLARDPAQARRVVIAELEAILEQEQAKALASASAGGDGHNADTPV